MSGEDRDTSPRISVVMATYRRAETIVHTLERLANQTLAREDMEVVVVDDGSPDDTASVVRSMQRDFPYRLQYLHHENRGPGYTQNQGIAQARAPVVMLMADDIWLVPGAVEAHLRMHDQHPDRRVAVLGKAVQSPALARKSVFLAHWDPWDFSRLDGATELPWYMFWACNLSVKKAFLAEGGNFRSQRGRAGAAAHEDVELGYRLRHHGLRLLYCEAALGEHYHESTLDQAIKRYHERGMNWDEFRSLMPDPEVVVTSHLLTRRTLREYRRVLSGKNDLRGLDRYLWWHLARTLVRGAVFNRVTDRLLWYRLLMAAETSPALAKLMNRRLYAGYLFHQFQRGVHDAERRFPGNGGEHVPSS